MSIWVAVVAFSQLLEGSLNFTFVCEQTFPSYHVPVQNNNRNNRKKAWSMFRVNNKNTRMTYNRISGNIPALKLLVIQNTP